MTNNGTFKNTTNNKLNDLAIVVLAAGCSSRLGQPKQLVTLYGKSLIEKQCDIVSKVSTQVYCILGYKADEISNKLNNNDVNKHANAQVFIVKNHNWKQGLGSSIACAVDNLPSQIKGVMLLLVDQWQLELKDIQTLINTWQEEETFIVASARYEKDKNAAENLVLNGPPVIFPKTYFKELSMLTNEQGAKKVIASNISKVKLVYVPNAIADLDTPEQLAKLKKYESRLKIFSK